MQDGNHCNSYCIIKFSDFYREFIQKYKFALSANKLTLSSFEAINRLVESNLMDDECQIVNMKIGEDISRNLVDGGAFI